MRRLALVAALLLPGPGVAEEPVAHDVTGVACSHCHADPHAGTSKEPCATCHRTEAWLPTTFGLERHTSFPLEGRHLEVGCTQCHTGHLLTGQPKECAGCHVDRHRGILGDDCTECHSPHAFEAPPGFDHARTGFVLAGHHEVGCASCHEGASGEALDMGLGKDCTTCHVPEHGDLGTCADCHRDPHPTFAAARSPDVFDHRATGFDLHRRHASQPCASCHPADAAAPVPRCASCHVDPHAGQLGVACEDCHREDRWRLVRFDHDLAGWALRGRHFVTPCADCHVSQRWVGLPTGCWDCHAADAAAAPRSIPAHAFGRTECGDCHTQWSW